MSCFCSCSQGHTWIYIGSCWGEARGAALGLRPPADFPWLFPAGIPSAPASVRVLNRTAHGIVVSWVPGFDAFSALNSCSVQVSIHNLLCLCTLPSRGCSKMGEIGVVWHDPLRSNQAVRLGKWSQIFPAALEGEAGALRSE